MTPDPHDRASEQEEQMREHALAQSRKASGPAPKGACLYCGERLPIPMRWCDADCRNDWQEEQRKRFSTTKANS